MAKEKKRTIMIMAGGTGGHIYPGLAVAEQLRAKGWQVVWMGVPGSMESQVVPKYDYPIVWVDFAGVRRKGLLRKLLFPLKLVLAMWQSLTAILEYRPDVVLGMGGYVSVPGGLMAVLLRKPLVVHEQNSVAGLSNHLLSRFAKRSLCGFPEGLPGAEWCGNPVREDIAALPEPEQRYSKRSGNLNVMVIGGSLGAQSINECVPMALALLPEDKRPEVLHQTGHRHLESVQKAYRRAGVEAAAIMPFLDNIAFFYDQADLVICRAGALTLAELAAAGLASILIPYPFGVDDHQTYNARFLSERGAAVLLPQKELRAQKLADLISEMTRERALEMAKAARAAAQPEAAKRVAEVCEELAEA